MRNHFTFRGTYGSGKTPCEVYAVKVRAGFWYAVEDSQNVNLTPVDLEEMAQPINVETLPDSDCFTSAAPVECCEDIEQGIEE